MAGQDHTQGWPTPGISARGLGGCFLRTWKRLRSGLCAFLVCRDLLQCKPLSPPSFLSPLPFHPLPSPLGLLAHPQTPVMWLFPQVLPRDAELLLTSLGLPPSCHPAFVPPGEAGLCGHADGFFHFAECDGRVQQQQGDIIVHVEFLKVLVQNYACDPLYFQGWAA